jgi:hypothetical protein
MFSRDVPSGLSLIREIEHQIDLELEAVIPNHPSYRNIHNEINELQS